MIVSNISQVKKRFEKLAEELVKDSFRREIIKQIHLEIQKFLKQFANQFQAEYLDVAEYYLERYGQSLNDETVLILNAIMDESIFRAFEVVETEHGIEINIDKDLAFFIGALEYGTKEIVADKSFTKVKEKAINIATKKINECISRLIKEQLKQKAGERLQP